MLLLALPICLTANQLLQIWLGVVPEYSVVFLQIIIIQSLFQVFDLSFYRALYSKGQIRENALISPTMGFVQFPIVYLLFKLGCSPVVFSWVSLVKYIILGLIVKPILVIKIVDYSWKDVFSVFIPCIKVSIMSIPIPLCFYYWFYSCENAILSFSVITLVSIASVLISSWCFGMDKTMKQRIVKFAFNKLKIVK